MSERTPSSYMDDGLDFEKRIPDGTKPWNIGKWVDDVNSSTPASTIGATLSYIDDGADLLPPRNRSGIGRVDMKYYADRKKEEGKPSRVYHPGMRRAVDGQIKNTLASMKALENFRISCNTKSISEEQDQEKRGKEDAKGEGNGPPPGAVRIWLPPPPPILVIHGKDGHIVVADGEDDPIDTRPPVGLKERLMQAEMVRRPNAKRQCDMQHKQNQNSKDSHGQPRQRSKNYKDRDVSPNEPTPTASEPHAWMSGGVGFPRSPSPESIWTGDYDDAQSTQPNYHAPTVEDAPELPVKGQGECLMGDDGPHETYCNASWGGIPVGVGNWENASW